MAQTKEMTYSSRFVGLAPKDWLTLANAAFGVLAIWLAFNGYPVPAFLAIVAAGIADYLDGLTARSSGAGADEFGKQLDSLSDAVSFGAAPCALAFSVGGGPLLAIGAIAYACAGVVRLARFNLQKEKGIFNGLPIPAAAFFSAIFSITAPFWQWVAMLVLAALMIAPFKLRKP